MAKFSILFLVVLADFTMEVWDNSKFNRARTLKGHHDVINDAFFSHDNKFIFSCSKDRSLIIWDLIGGQPISNIQLDSQIISMDCSSDGELVVTAIEGKREIFIWHNLVYMKPWGTEKIKL